MNRLRETVTVMLISTKYLESDQGQKINRMSGERGIHSHTM